MDGGGETEDGRCEERITAATPLVDAAWVGLALAVTALPQLVLMESRRPVVQEGKGKLDPQKTLAHSI